MSTAAIRTQTQVVAGAGKYLVISLGSELYGVPVPLVREIIRAQRVTPLPLSTRTLAGVIRLRDRVIPITDLRERFGLDTTLRETTCFVLVNLRTPEGREQVVGLIVDAVSEVLQIASSSIEPAPDLCLAFDGPLLLGIVKTERGVMTLLDIPRLFDAEREFALAASV